MSGHWRPVQRKSGTAGNHRRASLKLGGRFSTVKNSASGSQRGRPWKSSPDKGGLESFKFSTLRSPNSSKERKGGSRTRGWKVTRTCSPRCTPPTGRGGGAAGRQEGRERTSGSTRRVRSVFISVILRKGQEGKASNG